MKTTINGFGILIGRGRLRNFRTSALNGQPIVVAHEHIAEYIAATPPRGDVVRVAVTYETRRVTGRGKRKAKP